MLVVTLKFMPDTWRSKRYAISCIGPVFQNLVAGACSFHNHPLEASDVDFVPFEYQDGAVAAPLSIEIETYGYAGRKLKLDRETMLELKEDLLRNIQPYLAEGILNMHDRVLWMKYVDPDGLHV